MSEPEKENMKRGGRKDRKMRREGQQRQVNEGREKKKRRKGRETSAVLQRTGMLKVSIC